RRQGRRGGRRVVRRRSGEGRGICRGRLRRAVRRWRPAVLGHRAPPQGRCPRSVSARARLARSARLATGGDASRCRVRRRAPRRLSAYAHGEQGSEMNPRAKLAELGLTLPAVVPPVAAYVPAVQSGNHVYVSGQLPIADGELLATGKVGAEVSTEQAKQLAARCALNALAAVDALVGLERVVRVVKATGFVASAAGFTDQPAVVNGASELFGAVFGDAGRHARSAVGV